MYTMLLLAWAILELFFNNKRLPKIKIQVPTGPSETIDDYHTYEWDQELPGCAFLGVYICLICSVYILLSGKEEEMICVVREEMKKTANPNQTWRT